MFHEILKKQLEWFSWNLMLKYTLKLTLNIIIKVYHFKGL